MIMLSIIGGSTLAVLLLIMFFVGYFKAPTNKCFVISGLRKHARTVIGKAGFRFPFLERKDELTLDLISVDVKTQEAVPTAECINISVDAVANIKIGTSEEALAKAAQHFLNKDACDINATAREVLEGNLREIVGTMSLKAMMNDRKTFAEAVQQNAVPDLDRMGLEIISFNVQNFSDDQGVINNLGIDNIATISKNASIAKANAQKEVAVAEAKAREESNDAKVAADTAIAEKNNALEVRKAELEAERLKQVAKAEAAGAIEKETQRKTIEITKQNAEIARLEKETELKEQEISIKEKALDAEIKKQADAEKYAAEQKAAAFMYIKYLLGKNQQLTWADQTGYIPVTNNVINSSAYKNSTKSKVPAQLDKAMKNLYSVPVVKNSNAAYTQLNSIMQNIFAQAKKGQNWNSQIDAGKTKFQSAWNQ